MDLDVSVKTINEVTKHPNADRLDLARIGGYETVVGRDTYKAGDQVVYLPEASVLPQWLVSALGLDGKLAGKKRDRVKAVRLRGEVSQGVVVPLEDGDLVNRETGEVARACEIEDVAGFLGVTKYEPPIPVEMQGKVMRCPMTLPHYDVLDWKKDPESVADGREMVAVEKLHGTLTLIAWRVSERPDGPWVGSKGYSHKDFCFDTGQAAEGVLYRRTSDPVAGALKEAALAELAKETRMAPFAIAWIGETIGPKVQDLNYGLAKPELVVFELAVRWEGTAGWKYLETEKMMRAAEQAGVKHAPVIGTIAVERDVTRETIRRVQAFAEGPSLLAGNGQIREGVVLRHPSGTVRKAVSEAYLVRNKGTERR